MTPILLRWPDLAIAASLLLIDGGLSVWLRLGLERQLAIAAVRMVVQLVAVGLILRAVFAFAHPAITLLVILVMVAIASREVAARPEQRLARFGNIVVGGLSVALATFLTAILALTTAIRPTPWFDARYAIPLAGIILGNVLNSTSLGLDSLLGGVVRERAAIEASSPWRDLHQLQPVARARPCAAPLLILNQMAAAGVVTLPGFMTGHIFGGHGPAGSRKVSNTADFPIVRREWPWRRCRGLSGFHATHR